MAERALAEIGEGRYRRVSATIKHALLAEVGAPHVNRAYIVFELEGREDEMVRFHQPQVKPSAFDMVRVPKGVGQLTADKAVALYKAGKLFLVEVKKFSATGTSSLHSGGYPSSYLLWKAGARMQYVFVNTDERRIESVEDGASYWARTRRVQFQPAGGQQS